MANMSGTIALLGIVALIIVVKASASTPEPGLTPEGEATLTLTFIPGQPYSES